MKQGLIAPSMMCVEDVIDALNWAKSVGGLRGMIARSRANFDALADFVARSDWAEFLAREPEYRSNTSVCLSIKADWFKRKSPEEQKETVKKMVKLLGDEGVAFDCNAYKDAPAGLRFWCGATVESDDVKKLCPWLDWAYEQIKE